MFKSRNESVDLQDVKEADQPNLRCMNETIKIIHAAQLLSVGFLMLLSLFSTPDC